MLLLSINRHPSCNQLRWFGVAAAICAAVVATALHELKGWPWTWAIVILGIGIFTGTLCIFSARLGRYIFVGLTVATMPIGLTISYTAMACFYFLMLTPLAVLLRILGRDPLDRRFDGDARWHPHEQIEDPQRYFQQF